MTGANVSEASFLVAGFEPFDGRPRNRSWEVVRRLRGQGLETQQLPVDFTRLRGAVPTLLSKAPSALLMVGESPEEHVCVEQIALNVLDTDGADNSGAKPQMQALVTGGPLALRASWNARAVAHELNGIGVPARASFHAGTFACNAALYLALHASSETPIGFLHIPHRAWPRGLRTSVLHRGIGLCLQALTRPWSGFGEHET